MAIADFFTGRVEQREYAQELDFEFTPNYVVVTKDGVEVSRYVSSYTRSFVTAKVVEQTFRFTGCTASDAAGTSDVSVTDNGGTSWTVPMQSSITDGSSGARAMVVEAVQVQRVPISPRMWEVTVTRRGMRYFLNGVPLSLSNTPSWIGGYA